jgi:hypothetical protein
MRNPPKTAAFHFLTFLFSQLSNIINTLKLTRNLYQMVCHSPISQKSVSFSGTVRVKAALHINNYSEEEIQATWLDAADKQRIRREIRYTVEIINRGGTIDENECSRRGLEYCTSEGIQIRQKNGSAAVVNAVLDEQYEQEVEDFLDEEELANIYVDCGYRCQVIARLSALADMRFVRFLAIDFKDEVNTKLDYSEISFRQTALCTRYIAPRFSFGIAA